MPCVADVQIPIPAGHEFYVTTDDQYAQACDDKFLYMDYVSFPTLPFGDHMLIFRKTSSRSPRPAS